MPAAKQTEAQPEPHPSRRRARLLAWCALCAAIGAASICHTWNQPLGVCAGIYASGGYHLAAGKTLYRDVWDHKPPMVFLLNEGVQRIFGSVAWSARVLDTAFVCIGCALVFLIGRLALERPLPAALLAGLFAVHFTAPVIYDDGNLAEAYASVFVLAGALATLKAVKSERSLCRWGLLAGAFLAAAAWTKEPFILAALPCLALLAWRKKWRASWSFLAGGSLVTAAFLGWLAGHHILGDWLDVLSFGFRQTQVSQFSASWFDRILVNTTPCWANVLSMSLAGLILTAFCLIGLFTLPADKDSRAYLPAFAVGSFAAAYLGTLISMRAAGNYYVQIVPAYALCWIAGAHAIRRLRLRRRFSTAALLALLLLTAWQVPGWRRACPAVAPDPIPARIRRCPPGPLWVQYESACRYYLMTRRLSPTKYFFLGQHLLIDTAGTTRQQKIEQLRRDLASNPPVCIVLHCDAIELLDLIGLKTWLDSHYVMDTSGAQGVQLWVSKDAHGSGDHKERAGSM